MTVVAQELRLNELRRLGMSEPLIQLAAGNCIHKVFRDISLGPPFYIYHQQTCLPDRTGSRVRDRSAAWAGGHAGPNGQRALLTPGWSIDLQL
jgi:hypothetical protein